MGTNKNRFVNSQRYKKGNKTFFGNTAPQPSSLHETLISLRFYFVMNSISTSSIGIPLVSGTNMKKKTISYPQVNKTLQPETLSCTQKPLNFEL